MLFLVGYQKYVAFGDVLMRVCCIGCVVLYVDDVKVLAKSLSIGSRVS